MTDTPNSGDGGADWRGPILALGGENPAPEFKAALEGFKEPSEFIGRLTAKPETPDWRKLLAGDNTDRLKKLERFTDPNAFVESFEQKDAYINSGRKVTVPEEGASAEVIAAWNAARGVPDKPDGYQITAKPPEGLEIDDGTKTMLGGIQSKLHALGAEPAVVNAAHEIVYEQLAQAQSAQEAALSQGPKRATAELAKVWKNETELKENIAFASAGVQQFLGPMDGAKAEALLSIQTADGYYLSDHPEFVKLMAAVGRANAEDPLFLAASGAGDGAGSIDEQIAAIMKLRETDMAKYTAPETRARHEKLLAARARHRELQGGRAA